VGHWPVKASQSTVAADAGGTAEDIDLVEDHDVIVAESTELFRQ